jgi:1-acyl-sn-glycerol-3-phosphate acyltransferase
MMDLIFPAAGMTCLEQEVELIRNMYGHHIIFNFMLGILRLLNRRYTVLGKENVADGQPVVFLSNHLKMLGPYVVLLFFEFKFRAWVISNMFKIKSCADYLMDDFITKKLKVWKPLRKIAAYFFAFFCVILAKASSSIPAHRDSHMAKWTFEITLDAIIKGQNIFIFPEKQGVKYSEHLNELYDGFVHLARMAYIKTGRELVFHPVYIDKDRREIIIMESQKYEAKNGFRNEKDRLVEVISSMISKKAAENNAR